MTARGRVRLFQSRAKVIGNLVRSTADTLIIVRGEAEAAEESPDEDSQTSESPCDRFWPNLSQKRRLAALIPSIGTRPIG